MTLQAEPGMVVHTFVPLLRNLTQEDRHYFDASLGYIVQGQLELQGKFLSQKNETNGQER